MPRLSQAMRSVPYGRNGYIRLGRNGELPRGTELTRAGNVRTRAGYRVTSGGGVAYVGRS